MVGVLPCLILTRKHSIAAPPFWVSLTTSLRSAATLPTPRVFQKHLQRLPKDLAGSTCWSTMQVSRFFKPILNISYEEWSRVLAVNLTGPFLCAQAAVPLMRDSGGGAMVNITSISGLRASTLRTAYGTSKAGLAHLTQQQAIELASFGIRGQCGRPGARRYSTGPFDDVRQS